MIGSYLLHNELHYNGLMTDWGLECYVKTMLQNKHNPDNQQKAKDIQLGFESTSSPYRYMGGNSAKEGKNRRKVIV